jgi:hypothetical protein
MKIAQFQYKDAKGKVSQKEVLVIQEPTNKMSGIDISELSAEAQAIFVAQYAELFDEFKEKILALQKSHDLHFRYRNYLAENMSNLQTENV